MWTIEHGSSISVVVSEVHAVDDRSTDRNPELGLPRRADSGAPSKLQDDAAAAAKPRRRSGRPKRADAPKLPWPTIDAALVHGERQVDPITGEEVLQYPSLAVLAERYGVSRTLIWKFTHKKRCYERRKEAQAMVQARTDAKVIEKVANARAAATSDVAGIVDTFISRFRTALDKGEVRVDSAADLDRLVRLRELISGNADSRGEVLGQLTLEAIQGRHRRLRGQVEAITPELAGTTSHVAGDDDLRQDLGGEERGDGPAH
jgi:hypothetical protein